MYLRTVRLWNFRKYGSGVNELDLASPDLLVPFSPGLNVLIGGNDSGKTAIIEAVKIVLRTHSAEWIALDDEDFFGNSTHLRIECELSGFSDEEAGHFAEWVGWEGSGSSARPLLNVFVDARRTESRILPYDVRAGSGDDGALLSADAKEFIKTTFLRPLRDARAEMIPKRNSRLSQILRGHPAFKNDQHNHYLVQEFDKLNNAIENYFEGRDANGSVLAEAQSGRELKDEIDRYLRAFADKTSQLEVAPADIKQILERLELDFAGERNLGLGSYNILFISTELLHLNRVSWNGLRLGLVEEIEAHLHPQLQLLVMQTLQEIPSIQLIISTHSPNIGSKVGLENLIVCHKNQVFPMGPDFTKLSSEDYGFLERFLDVTKANLFFAKGVILVEGWGEELFLPVLARAIGIDLTVHGVSIVNIGNTAFLRYSRIYQRKQGAAFDLPVAVVTDLDVKPNDEEKKATQKKSEKESKYNGGSVRTFVSPHWTFEYCVALSDQLSEYLFQAVKEAGSQMEEDGYSGKRIVEEWASITAGKSKSELAMTVFDELLRGRAISKTIVAQNLAGIVENLPAGTLDVEALKQDTTIKYLIEAIRYASGY